MRICIPIHSFEPGGVERVGLRLAERWQASGEEVTIVLGRDRGPTRAQAPTLNYRTRPEPFSTAAWETPWLIWCLWRYLRRNQADVLFCPGNTYTIVCVAMKLLLGRDCPPVVVKISNDLVRPDFPAPVRLGYGLWLKIQGRLLDYFVALAEPMRAEIEREMSLHPDRTITIPNPVLRDEEVAATPVPSPDPAQGRHFVTAARLNRQKNLPMLLDAFAAMRQPGDRLSIAGEGPERSRIERYIADRDLGGTVCLLGHVDDVRSLLDGAHVLVLSSDYEGLPGAVIEALAAGRPVAATDCCASMRWLLHDEEFGALAPVGDVNALAAAMERAAAMTPPANAMHRFASAFTLEQAAPSYLTVMHGVAGSAAPLGIGGEKPARC